MAKIDYSTKGMECMQWLRVEKKMTFVDIDFALKKFNKRRRNNLFFEHGEISRFNKNQKDIELGKKIVWLKKKIENTGVVKKPRKDTNWI